MEDPGVYMGEEIFKLLEQQVSESSYLYIYIYIYMCVCVCVCVCDSEQTAFILPMEHLDFPDQQS